MSRNSISDSRQYHNPPFTCILLSIVLVFLIFRHPCDNAYCVLFADLGQTLHFG